MLRVSRKLRPLRLLVVVIVEVGGHRVRDDEAAFAKIRIGLVSASLVAEVADSATPASAELGDSLGSPSTKCWTTWKSISSTRIMLATISLSSTPAVGDAQLVADRTASG
jgi:hypothetical protein